MAKSSSLGWLLVPALLGACVVTANTAKAGTVFETASGSTTSGGAVDAKVDFTFGSGSLTIVLTNLQQNLKADSQQLSGISFDIVGLTGSGSLSTTNSGLISTISSGGAYTAGASDALTRWKASHATSTVTLTTLSGGQPDRLIIGPDNNGGFNPMTGSFSNANASVIQHQPSVLGSATFVVSIAGVNSSSVIEKVNFLFGTEKAPNTEHVPGINSVPEPASVAMVSVGLSAAMLFLRRRKSA